LRKINCEKKHERNEEDVGGVEPKKYTLEIMRIMLYFSYGKTIEDRI
jgi:hypothetical protein